MNFYSIFYSLICCGGGFTLTVQSVKLCSGVDNPTIYKLGNQLFVTKLEWILFFLAALILIFRFCFK